MLFKEERVFKVQTASQKIQQATGTSKAASRTIGEISTVKKGEQPARFGIAGSAVSNSNPGNSRFPTNCYSYGEYSHSS